MTEELYALISNKLVDAGLPYPLHSNVIPNGTTFPCVRMAKISERFLQTKEPSFYGQARWQIDVFANKTYNNKSPQRIIEECGDVILELNGYLGDGEIIEIRVEDVEFDFEESVEVHIYRIDFLIQHN